MKSLKLIVLLAITGLFTINTNAQNNLKYYTYSIYISSASFSGCSSESTVYFSPIVNHTFDDEYRIFDAKETEGAKIARRWKSKIKANYTVRNDYCFVAKTEYWNNTYSAIDTERDKWIKFYKDQGYKVYSSYSSFGFN